MCRYYKHVRRWKYHKFDFQQALMRCKKLLTNKFVILVQVLKLDCARIRRMFATGIGKKLFTFFFGFEKWLVIECRILRTILHILDYRFSILLIAISIDFSYKICQALLKQPANFAAADTLQYLAMRHLLNETKNLSIEFPLTIKRSRFYQFR